jgi:predicted phage-related endonuclease
MNETISAKVKEYADMRKMMNELQDLMDGLEQEIKAAMGDSEEMSVEGIKVKWTRYTTSRFDSKTFKAEHGAMYEQYVKTSQARRFQVVA